jgi:hypothetical protein
VNNISKILQPLTKTQYPMMLLCEKSVEAYEQAGGKATNALPLDVVIIALQRYIKSLLELKEAMIAEVERDTSATIARYVELINKQTVYPDIIPKYNINKETEESNQIEKIAVTSIDNQIGWLIEQAQGLLDRAEKIETTRS